MLAGWIATIYVAAALVPGPDFAYEEPPAPEPATIEEATAVDDGSTAEASATWEEPAWTCQDAAWAEPERRLGKNEFEVSEMLCGGDLTLEDMAGIAIALGLDMEPPKLVGGCGAVHGPMQTRRRF